MSEVVDLDGEQYEIESLEELPRFLPIKLQVTKNRYLVVLVPTRVVVGGRGAIYPGSMFGPGEPLGYLEHASYRDCEPLTRRLSYQDCDRVLFWLQERRAHEIPGEWLDPTPDPEDPWDPTWGKLREKGFMDNAPEEAE